jgi:hypothetical protein
MKIELEPTGRFEDVQGVRCRIWKGMYQGHAIVAHIPMVGLHKDAPESAHAQWGRELSEVKVERQLAYFDNRMVLD